MLAYTALNGSLWLPLELGSGAGWCRVVQGGVHPQDEILYMGARVLAEALTKLHQVRSFQFLAFISNKS